jgi:hypothetical protein
MCSTVIGGSALFHHFITPRITARGTGEKNCGTSTTITWRMLVRARMPSSLSANMSTITRASAPESRN